MPLHILYGLTYADKYRSVLEVDAMQTHKRPQYMSIKGVLTCFKLLVTTYLNTYDKFIPMVLGMALIGRAPVMPIGWDEICAFEFAKFCTQNATSH